MGKRIRVIMDGEDYMKNAEIVEPESRYEKLQKMVKGGNI